jgi:toxin YoeB
MEIVYTDKAIDDIIYWKKKRNDKIQIRISELINSIEIDPFKGIGKPEPLKYQLSGKWSRRIDKANRIIYEVMEELIVIHSLKGHYD